MTEPERKYEEGDPLDGSLETGEGACAAPHPLVSGVVCQRLPGHPGSHTAVADTDAAELTLEWNGE